MAKKPAGVDPPRRKRGRPKGPPGEKRSYTLRIRLKADERKAVEEAAGREGQETATWARGVLLGKVGIPISRK